MTRTYSCVVLSAALACLLLSCARQAELVKLYDEGGDHEYRQFFVVGIAGDADARRALEDAFSAELRGAGAKAVSGYTMTGPKTTLLQEEIDAAARESNSDAILVTHIVSVDTSVKKQEGRSDIIAECRGGDPAEYFLYDYEVLKEPDTVRVAHTVVAVTSLYDTAARKRRWTVQSTCFEKATIDEALIEEAEAVTRQLRIDDLIG